jgi:hypothetical protein
MIGIDGYTRAMLKHDAIHFFGTQASLAKALDITTGAISQWGEHVPESQAYKLQIITGGRLQVDPSCYKPNRQAA